MFELSQRREIIIPFGIVLYIICMTFNQLLQKGDLVVGLCDQFRDCHRLAINAIRIRRRRIVSKDILSV